MTRPTIAERIREHVDIAAEGCWEWAASRDKKNGYGRINISGRVEYAHRASYTTFIGPIPAGLQIDHLCRNAPCVNPAHLEAVTPLVNVRRSDSPGAIARRRSACLYGHPYEEHGFIRGGRRRCDLCRRLYRSAYKATPPGVRAARKAAGLPVVDLAAIVESHTASEAA